MEANILEGFLSGRKLAPSTAESYRNAVKSWESVSDSKLAEASGEDVGKWYRSISGDHKSGTVLTYYNRLRVLHLHVLEKSGIKKREAIIRVGDVWESLPIQDLNRDTRLHRNDRDKLVTTDDVDRLIKSAKHPRVQSLIAMLVETGARKGELRSLRIRDVEFGKTYTLIRIAGKTGERSIPVVNSVPYLKAWLMVHPDRRPDQWLFCIEHGGEITQLSEYAINTTLRYLAKKNGLRHVYPHELRHSRLTQLAGMNIGDFVLKSYAGWTANSRQAGTYIHLSGKSHIDPILEAQGLKAPSPDSIKPLLKSGGHCPKCDALTAEGAAFCSSCGYVLDPNLTTAPKERDYTVDMLEQRLADLEEKFRREKEAENHAE